MPKTSYKAEEIKNLALARNILNPEILDKISKRGDLTKFSNKFNIETHTFIRAIAEAKILSFFPRIFKSKTVPLSRIKTDKELKLFTKRHNINKIGTRQIYKLVKEWRKKLEENPKILLTSLQHDLIIGSSFGDGSIRQREKNCSFRVSHSRKQEKYLLWKYNILKEFTLSKPTWNRREVKGHNVETLELATATHYSFNYYRKLFYKNGRKTITREALNLLNPRSLAIWLCDDGSYDNKQGYIVLCTNSFKLEEHKIMKKYFEEIWGLSPTIGFRDKKYYYLRFKQEDSRKLIEIVKLFVLNFMRYKIGEKNA